MAICLSDFLSSHVVFFSACYLSQSLFFVFRISFMGRSSFTGDALGYESHGLPLARVCLAGASTLSVRREWPDFEYSILE